MKNSQFRPLGLAATLVGLTLIGATRGDIASTPNDKPTVAIVPDATEQGEPASIVQIANLVYAGTKSSQCFSDH